MHDVQGNEFSYYMLLTSAFLLNHMAASGQYMVHPWLHSNCNQFSDEDQLRAVSFRLVHQTNVTFSNVAVCAACHPTQEAHLQVAMLAKALHAWQSLSVLAASQRRQEHHDGCACTRHARTDSTCLYTTNPCSTQPTAHSGYPPRTGALPAQQRRLCTGP